MAKKSAPKKPAGRNLFAAHALSLAASASVPVTFNCSSAACLVSIQMGLVKTTFVSSGQMLLPKGRHQLTLQVQGPGVPFSLTATGAQMAPVNGVASMAGLVPIVV